MEGVYRTLLVPAANAFKEIQYRGLYIDRDRQLDLLEDWYNLKWSQEDELNRIVHEEDPTMGPDARLNFGSHTQMKRFMYDVLKSPPQFKKADTHGGAPAEPKLTTDKFALEALKDFHPFFSLFHEWRQTDHQISVSNGVWDRVKDDGMLHAVPMIHGTETGRLSYQDPNLQNWAQPWMVGDDLARIREIIAPRNPETHVIAEADYRQIELWMAWMWSQDKNMLADLETGDFHRVTAMGVFNKTWDEVQEADRFWTKMITFGRLYERGAADMKRNRGFESQSIAELEEWVLRWSRRYIGYITWAEKLKRQAREEGVIVSPWGRKRRYYLVMGESAHHMLRSALNFCMQSTGHDYTLTSLIQIQPQLAALDSYILTENHDAILFELSRKYFWEAIDLITNVMENVRPNSDWPKLRVDWKAGPNWGQAHKFKHEKREFNLAA
jgi:DNA polymerase-1